MSEQTYEDLIGKNRKRFVATGDTYPHREVFTSCAWHWNPERKAWIEDNGSDESDIVIQAIMDLPGVKVAIENPNETGGLNDG